MVHNGSNVTLMVLDNSTTAMTGHQDHPGTENTLEGKGKGVDIEKLVRAIGVEHVSKRTHLMSNRLMQPSKKG
jgi:indolepyruvate ferredoxin oxidoreductase alpha subunit